MASIVLSGAVTAAHITNPYAAAFAYAAAAYAGSMIDQALFSPPPPGLSVKNITKSQQNTPLPIIYGEDGWRCEYQIPWARDYFKKRFQSGYHAYATFAVALCYSPLGVASQDIIWFNGKVWYDRSRLKNKSAPHSFWNGDQSAPDSLISSHTTTSMFPKLVGHTFQRLPVFGFGNQIPSQASCLVRAPAATLQTVLEAESAMAGMSSDEYDFSEGAGTPVRSCAHEGVQDSGNFKQQVCDWYGFDIFESGVSQRIRAREGDADYAIEWDDLGCIDNGPTEPTQRIVETIQYDLEIPFQVVVNYIELDEKNLRQPGQVVYTRDTAPGQVPAILDYPMIGATPEEALGAAKRWLAEADIRRTQYEFSLGPKYYKMEPGDRVTLPLDGEGTTVTVRIFEIQDRNPLGGPFKVLAYRCGGGTYSQSGGGVDDNDSTHIDDEPLVDASAILWSDPDLEPFPNDPAVAKAGFWAAITCPSLGGDDFDVYVQSPSMSAPELIGAMSGRSVIGAMVGAMDDGIVAEDFEMRSGAVLLNDTGSLDTISEDEARVGGGFALIGREFVNLVGVTQTGSLAYDIDEVRSGLLGSAMDGHANDEPFVMLDGAQRFSGDWAIPGTVVDVFFVPSDSDQTPADVTPYSVTIATPRAPWDGTGADANTLTILEYDWDADDTQNVVCFPKWTTAAAAGKQTALGKWSTSGNNGSTWTEQGIAALWKGSLASGTIKFRFEPALPTEGDFGTPIYSANYTYRTPPTGSGGGGSSTRGTRVLFTETTDPAGNTITSTSETAFNSSYTVPGGFLIAGQILHLRLAGVLSGVGNYAARVYLGADEIGSTAVPVTQGSGYTHWSLEADIVVRADGASGEVQLEGLVRFYQDNGDIKIDYLRGAPVSVDLSTGQALSVTWDWVSGGKSVTAEEFSVILYDLLGGASSGTGVVQEEPTGTINGVNGTFALLHTPIADSEQVFVNGIGRRRGTHYNVSGSNIVFTAGNLPLPADSEKAQDDWITVNYSY